MLVVLREILEGYVKKAILRYAIGVLLTFFLSSTAAILAGVAVAEDIGFITREKRELNREKESTENTTHFYLRVLRILCGFWIDS